MLVRHSALIEYIQHSLIALPKHFMPIILIRARPLPIKALTTKFNMHVIPTSNKSYSCLYLECYIGMAIKGLNTIF